MLRCFHCNEPVPAGTELWLDVAGERRPVCCPGCRAVAQLIQAQGLTRFYDFRSAPALKPDSRAAADDYSVCDRPELEAELTEALAPDCRELRCRVDGVNCAACAWLIDRGLRSLNGVDDVTVNPLTGETAVRFDPGRLKPSHILQTMADFGFVPRPLLRGARAAAGAPDRSELKRLAVAGLGFAQIMSLSAALYLGAFKAMEASYTSFFVLASMLVATPVVLYAGAPIFRGAWADLQRRRLGMDVPVSLAMVSALGASLINAFRGEGAVYFDSATMFVFFLTLGRFLEARARHRAGSVLTALAELRPLSATRRRNGQLERIGSIELRIGDRVLVAPGEAVPADGALMSSQAVLDESLLSGESLGRRRMQGETVLGGSLNVGTAPVEIEVSRLGADSYVERVGSLLNRAMGERPAFLQLADRWAAGFVGGILLLTALTGGVWVYLAPARAFEVVLAMLVVTCPCALSLAAPTAFAVALGRLARYGILLRSASVIERLGDVTLWLFDKTGTLTEGHIGIGHVETYTDLDAAACLRLAAALEAGVEHPIARALARSQASDVAAEVSYRPGFGVAGWIDGRRYRLGSARHVGLASAAVEPAGRVFLADDAGLLARIEMTDRLRATAPAALDSLAASGAEIRLLSGDSAATVAAVAARLGTLAYLAEQDPAQKLAFVQARQQAGDVVAAVGDGINDAPLLAQADVSIAMLSGSRLAQASADIVFTGEDLRLLARLPEWARRTERVVRENLLWAVLYNAVAVPLAATGVLTPWMAALGMSLSSLIVVANALRLNRGLAQGGAPRRVAGSPTWIPEQGPA